jgi:hypothetical protein
VVDARLFAGSVRVRMPLVSLTITYSTLVFVPLTCSIDLLSHTPVTAYSRVPVNLSEKQTYTWNHWLEAVIVMTCGLVVTLSGIRIKWSSDERLVLNLSERGRLGLNSQRVGIFSAPTTIWTRSDASGRSLAESLVQVT